MDLSKIGEVQVIGDQLVYPQTLVRALLLKRYKRIPKRKRIQKKWLKKLHNELMEDLRKKLDDTGNLW